MNRKFLKIIGLLIIGLFLISACGLRTIKGSGDVITESREVSGFDSVSHTGIGRVIITQGDKESLTIEADDNLLEHITSEVKNGTLELGFTDNVRIDSASPITFTVGVKDLKELDSTGTGSIEIDELGADNLNISKSGTGSISIGTLTATDLVVKADGTGNIELAGTVVKQELELMGTGDYDAPDLESQTASVGVTGTGSVVMWVLDSLDVEITGTSKVSYFGSPNVTESITGTGGLTSLGDK
ncbi:MAG: DUF2807 domain-containing protein [Anaerolineales bacterium]|nr:DUF2807 domain-containing protein [Anaerolineales bacterium]